MKRTYKLLLVIAMLAFTTLPVSAYTFSVKTSKSTVAPGERFRLNVNFSGEGRFKITVSNGKASVQNFWYPDDESKNIFITAGSSGTVTITVKAVDATTSDFEQFDEKDNISRSVKVKISKPSKPTVKPPTLDDTENDKKKPPVKTPEEIEAEKLEERKNIPLISGINVVSNSDRLNGEVIKEIVPQKGLFNYRYALPRSVDEFSLDIKGITEDVELTYEKNHKFSEENSIEVKVVAKQDVVVQEYVLTLERPVEVSTTYRISNDSYRVIEDDYLSVQMREFGFTKSSIDVNDVSKGSYYSINNSSVLLAANESNDAKWLLLDENLEVDREVVIVGHEVASLLVPDVKDAADKKLQGTNKYRDVGVVIPEKIKGIDNTLKFKAEVGGWDYDGEGTITHAINDEGDVEVVHLSNEGEVKTAYVIFDQASGFSLGNLTYVFMGLWVVTIGLFFFEKKRMNRKIDALIGRRSSYDHEG